MWRTEYEQTLRGGLKPKITHTWGTKNIINPKKNTIYRQIIEKKITIFLKCEKSRSKCDDNYLYLETTQATPLISKDS